MSTELNITNSIESIDLSVSEQGSTLSADLATEDTKLDLSVEQQAVPIAVDLSEGDEELDVDFGEIQQTGSSGGTSVQADWSQNDESQPDFVKNRTHWLERPFEPIVWDGNTEGRDSIDLGPALGAPTGLAIAYKISDTLPTPEQASEFTVSATIGGQTESSKGVELAESGIPSILAGQFSAKETIDGTLADFAAGTLLVVGIAGDFSAAIPGFVVPSTGTYILPGYGFPYALHIANDTVHKLDAMFIPNTIARTNYVDEKYANWDATKMNTHNPSGTGAFSLNRLEGTTIGEWSFSEGYRTTASGQSSHAEGDLTTASGPSSHAEGNQTTASGQSSHAEGLSTTASGDHSHAEGHGTTAGGDWSHAEGYDTTASGDHSHAEGHDTTASGDCSHAEGLTTTASKLSSHAEGHRTIASGNYSHAEGNETIANGYSSHSEGSKTIASGSGSHAEGLGTAANGPFSHSEGSETTANGPFSHAEGSETVTSGRAQHVQGEYNLIEPFPPEANARTKYAHIVGNGTSDANRSNAHTLDWDGLGWFAGGLKVGGTGQDDEAAVDVLTTADIDSIVAKVLEALAAQGGTT